MRSRFPWRDTSEDIAENARPQWETPAGAQEKADKAEQAAKDYSDERLAEHVGTGGSAHSLAVPDAEAGFISGVDQAKLNGIQAGAEINQNAYSVINNIPAGQKEDHLTITAGTGITVTPDPANKEIRITSSGTAIPGKHGTEHLSNGADPIPEATGTFSGLMSAADKVALDTVVEDVESLAGAGRTTETVKGNADAIADVTAQLADVVNGAKSFTKINLKNVTPLTIASGAITVTQGFHQVDTGGAAKEDLTSINGGNVGDLLYLRGVSTVRAINIKPGIGNIYTFDGTDVLMSNGNQSIIALIKINAANWVVIGNQGVKKSGDEMTGSLSVAGYLAIKGTSESRISNSSSAGREILSITAGTSTSNGAAINLYGSNDASGPDQIVFFTGNNNRARISSSGQFTVTGQLYIGAGAPEGAVTAPIGAIYQRTDGGANTTLYVKQSGTGNTGWVAK